MLNSVFQKSIYNFDILAEWNYSTHMWGCSLSMRFLTQDIKQRHMFNFLYCLLCLELFNDWLHFSSLLSPSFLLPCFDCIAVTTRIPFVRPCFCLAQKNCVSIYFFIRCWTCLFLISFEWCDQTIWLKHLTQKNVDGETHVAAAAFLHVLHSTFTVVDDCPVFSGIHIACFWWRGRDVIGTYGNFVPSRWHFICATYWHIREFSHVTTLCMCFLLYNYTSRKVDFLFSKLRISAVKCARLQASVEQCCMRMQWFARRNQDTSSLFN